LRPASDCRGSSSGKHPAVIVRTSRTPEGLRVAAAIAGAAHAHPSIVDAVEIVAVAVPGLEGAVRAVISEIHFDNDERIAGFVEHGIGIVALVAIGMAGIRLVVCEVGERLADLDIALRRSRWAAIIGVGGNWLV